MVSPSPSSSSSGGSPDDKRAIRKRLITRREALAAGEVEQCSRRVFETFSKDIDRLLPRSCASVALYSPIRGEVDTRAFHRLFRKRGLRCLYPRVDTAAKSLPLRFHEVNELSELRLGAFGIAEPSPTSPTSRPDLVLVPAIAYTSRADRLGYGGGHFDATIESWTASGDRASIRLIGLAYEFQILSELPRESHDHAVDFVVTESHIFERAGA